MSPTSPRSRVRGRFEIVCPFEGGGSLTITSSKEKSLTRREVIAALRRYADILEEPDRKRATR